MPTLLELQYAMRSSLVQDDDEAASALLAAGVALDRLNIYRNTIVTGLTKSLRLSFPAVERLVGAEFFDGAVRHFIAAYPPRAAYLESGRRCAARMGGQRRASRARRRAARLGGT